MSQSDMSYLAQPDAVIIGVNAEISDLYILHSDRYDLMAGDPSKPKDTSFSSEEMEVAIVQAANEKGLWLLRGTTGMGLLMVRVIKPMLAARKDGDDWCNEEQSSEWRSVVAWLSPSSRLVN